MSRFRFHYDHYAFNLSSLHVFLQSSALNIKAGVLPLKSGLLLCFGFAIHAALGTWKNYLSTLAFWGDGQKTPSCYRANIYDFYKAKFILRKSSSSL
jgi:hypothetical protein